MSGFFYALFPLKLALERKKSMKKISGRADEFLIDVGLPTGITPTHVGVIIQKTRLNRQIDLH